MEVILQRQIFCPFICQSHLTVSVSTQQEMLPTCFACGEGTWERAGNSGRRMLAMYDTSSTAEGHEDEKLWNTNL